MNIYEIENLDIKDIFQELSDNDFSILIERKKRYNNDSNNSIYIRIKKKDGSLFYLNEPDFTNVYFYGTDISEIEKLNIKEINNQASELSNIILQLNEYLKDKYTLSIYNPISLEIKDELIYVIGYELATNPMPFIEIFAKYK